MQGEVKITVIATGFGRNRKPGLQSSPTATENTTIEYSKPKPEPARPAVTDDDDLNIPAFLRNRI